jgi:sulfate adenylyltransferase subunit 1
MYMDLLRFFTAGNVDDGKSTLIGRLLYDSKSISTDIIETLTRQSKNANNDTEIDLALLTDGLRAEREQGITIDVAYKFFTTSKRKFIIADTPGHIQYTRNMFTGASNADLAIILIDARHGVTDQTRRHSILSSILGIPYLIVCVNKMDMELYSEARFQQIKEQFMEFSDRLNLNEIQFIPVSALCGDNVVNTSTNMRWYDGPTLMKYLEEVDIQPSHEQQVPRFQVQYVIRPQSDELHDYRGFAGVVKSGFFRVGSRVRVLPSNMESTLSRIELNGEPAESAEVNRPAIFHLIDDVDISRGGWIADAEQLPLSTKEFTATICWMDQRAYSPGQKFLLQHGSHRTKAAIRSIIDQIDIHTFEHTAGGDQMQLNDICKVIIKTADVVHFDPYMTNRSTGAFILIDDNTNNTVAAGTME